MKTTRQQDLRLDWLTGLIYTEINTMRILWLIFIALTQETVWIPERMYNSVTQARSFVRRLVGFNIELQWNCFALEVMHLTLLKRDLSYGAYEESPARLFFGFAIAESLLGFGLGLIV
jgi:hypothetical protein